jgi:hypothetical protein
MSTLGTACAIGIRKVIFRIEIEYGIPRVGKGSKSMVTRTLLTATLAAGLSVGLLAEDATGAEGLVLQKAPLVAESAVDIQVFRSEIDSYVRELNEQMRTTLGQDLRRELAPKIVLASNELRAQG